jgi:hypothetical protein
MRRFPGRAILWIAAATVVIALGAALAATYIRRWQEVDTTSDEQKLARSLEIIRTSTPTNRKVLKVLFYGQSITRSGWDKAVIEHWHEKYPNTVFVTQNRALGGFSSLQLLRTTEEDIAAFYPDLIIFHVYGDHRAYEKIIRLLRSRTAADVVVQTDHGEELPDPPCEEGLQLTLHRQPGCEGTLWVHQRLWSDEMSYHKIPAYGKKYGLAVEPQRAWWRDYLLRTHIDPKSMLVDQIHPNAQGKTLIAGFFNQYFDNLVDHWNGETEHLVVPVAGSVDSSGQETVEFEGNRLEILSSKPLSPRPGAAIDGTAPKDIDGCYLATRASSVQTVPDWPALRRITLRHDHTPQEWTATLTGITPDQNSFQFSVTGSVTGDEGQGDSAHDFVSKSGQISIESQDWMLARAFAEKHIPLSSPFVVRWSVVDMCDGDPEVIDLGNGASQYRYVVGTGLANGKHSVRLTAMPNDAADKIELRAYQPPLHN